MKKNILITGITGFLGSNLAEFLAEKHNVFGLIRPNSDLTRVKNLKKRISLKKIDINNFKLLSEELKGIDIVINCSIVYGKNNERLSEILLCNVFNPISILDACLLNKVYIFINIDTFYSEKYGYLENYIKSKSNFKDWANMYTNQLSFINICANHLYGPKDNLDKFIPFIILKLLCNEKEILLSKGNQKRKFTSTFDLCQFIELVIANSKCFKKQFYNLIPPFNLLSIKKLVLHIKRITCNNSSLLKFGAIDCRKNEKLNSKNISTYKNPKFIKNMNCNFEKDMQKTVEWFKIKYEKN